MSSLARTIALAFTTLALASNLTGCFRFDVGQGVNVWPTPPDDPSLAYCHQLHVTAIFGTRTLIDTTFTVGDDEVAAIEADNPQLYRGMPLTIDTTCYDTDQTVIGQSHHLGRLQDPSGRATVVVVNYPLHGNRIPPSTPPAPKSASAAPADSTGTERAHHRHGRERDRDAPCHWPG